MASTSTWHSRRQSSHEQPGEACSMLLPSSHGAAMPARSFLRVGAPI
uniref:Uncharacterized protein n=1 Tax=Arundo donax TaxID=35708 RepID=A0A0A9H371_ARUDO